MNPIEQIKDRLSILDVVSMYIKLEKSGNQYKGRCPFHSEKTPSFYVSPNFGNYHCFGCGKGGDIFSFLQEIEHIPFKEALHILAEKSGVDITKNSGSKTDIALTEVLEITKKHFQSNLQKLSAPKLYLEERGLSQASIDKFELGYALDEWRDVTTYLEKNGFPSNAITKAGVCIESQKGGYDRWRGRLMFPIHNASGKCIGFTGRLAPFVQNNQAANQGKYVNSPETDLYHKSKVLYGYHLAKQSISKADKCYVVEGQFDVILAAQAGTENVVGVSGTAFTDEQLTLIKRLTNNIVLCLDADDAGQQAMIKSAKAAYMLDCDVSVVALPNGHDPADIIKKSPEEWRQIISKEMSVIEFLLEKAVLEGKDKKEQTKNVAKKVFPVIASVQSSMLRQTYINFIAQKLGIEIRFVQDDFSNYLHTQESTTSSVVQEPKDVTRKTPSLLLEYFGILEHSSKKKFYHEELVTFIKEVGVQAIQEIPHELLLPSIIRYEYLKNDDEQLEKQIESIKQSLFEKIISKKIEELSGLPERNIQEELLLIKKRDTIRKTRK